MDAIITDSNESQCHRCNSVAWISDIILALNSHWVMMTYCLETLYSFFFHNTWWLVSVSGWAWAAPYLHTQIYFYRPLGGFKMWLYVWPCGLIQLFWVQTLLAFLLASWYLTLIFESYNLMTCSLIYWKHILNLAFKELWHGTFRNVLNNLLLKLDAFSPRGSNRVHWIIFVLK